MENLFFKLLIYIDIFLESKSIDQNVGCNLKTEPIKSVKVPASITCCDDLPDPAEQPVMILESGINYVLIMLYML